ncbi:MAG: beta-ketoacyl synthase chain length factor [Ramlibacter sp.]
MNFNLHAAGVLAPGLASLADLRAACDGSRPLVPAPLQVPSPAMLPAHERRRASQVVRLVLACVAQALETSPFAPETLRSVFATDEGTGEVCHQMLEAVTTTRQVSPLVFPNSVHNAPSGYFSIAWRNREPATVVSLGLESFASGLLCAVTDAVATRQPVLLVVYDPAMTSPLNELLTVNEPIACAWILSAGEPGAQALASFSMELQAQGALPSALPSWLPQAWSAHSSARALAALGLLETADGECRFSLGSQVLALRRTDGTSA